MNPADHQKAGCEIPGSPEQILNADCQFLDTPGHDAQIMPNTDSLSKSQLDPVRDSGTASQADETVHNSKNELSIENSFIPTKTSDGPSPVTLTTNNLIHLLLKQGQINKRDILETLRKASSTGPVEPPADVFDAQSEKACSDKGSPALDQDGHGARRSYLLDRAVCSAVHARLQSLADRVASQGRAAMLPSTDILGRPLLPALLFLAAASGDIVRSIELSLNEEE
jgi:hypothetical protein